MTASTLMEMVEKVRGVILLSRGDFADLIGVSRMTYYNWTEGRTKPRGKQRARLQEFLRALVLVISQGQWPAPGARALSAAKRKARLLAEIEKVKGV